MLVKVAQEGMQELIGPAEIREATEEELSYERAFLALERLEDMYGHNGGCGLALRSGRASFAHFLRQFGAESGLTDISFRLQPTHLRLYNGMKRLLQVINRQSDFHLQADELDDTWQCRLTGRLYPQQPDPLAVAGYYLAGLLQEYLSWASGGKSYMLKSVECCHHNACLITISQKALE